MRRLILTGLLLAFLAAAGARATCAAQGLLNKKAPEFSRTDLNGHALDLARFRGKVVLLNFWATWCAPCLSEMPVFSGWQQQYGPQGLQVIGISMDDDMTLARQVVNRLNLNYPVIVGDEHIGARYGGILGLPVTFLIDRQGVIRAQFKGEVNQRLVKNRLKALLSRQ